MTSNLKAALCYLFGAASGIIFLVIEKDDEFVRKSAAQSIAITIAYIILSIGFRFSMFDLGYFLLILKMGFFVLQITLMIKALKNIYFKLPVVGDFGEKHFFNLFR